MKAFAAVQSLRAGMRKPVQKGMGLIFSPRCGPGSMKPGGDSYSCYGVVEETLGKGRTDQVSSRSKPNLNSKSAQLPSAGNAGANNNSPNTP